MRRSWVLAIACAVLVAFGSTAMAGQLSQNKLTKQYAGSTGDSLVAAADTSVTEVLLPTDITAMWMVGACDSTCRYYLQVSPDGTYWFTVETDSTTAASSAYGGTDHGDTYAGMYARVIQDAIPASAAANYQAAWVYWKR